MKKYTTKEAADILNVNIRTVQRHLATLSEELTNNDKKGILIPQDVVNLLKKRHDGDTMTTDERHNDDNNKDDDFDYYEAFTTDEYIEFQKRINEYPILKEYIENLKEQIEFLRFNTAQQNETIKDLSTGIKQRNFIEAKEKGLDRP